MGVPAAASLPPPPPPPPGITVRYPHAGRVPRGPGAGTWLGGILLRNLRGTLAGLFAAWFNVPFVVMMAGVGAVFGAMAGTVSGTFAGPTVLGRIDTFFTWIFPLPVKAQDLLPTAGAQIGGIIGGLLGALNGGLTLAWMAFAYPWEALYAGDPMWPLAVALGQVVTALFVGFLYTGVVAWTEPLWLQISGARRLSRREAAWLMPIVYECGARMGLPTLPRVMVNDRREVSAEARLRHIVIYRGLLDEFSYDRYAISGVIAHELAHWSEGHVVTRTFSAGVALPLVILYQIFARLTGLTIGVKETEAGGLPGRVVVQSVNVTVKVVRLIAWLLGWSVIVTARYLVAPVQAGAMRSMEYQADAIAKAAGYGDGLHMVLTRLRRSFDRERAGWDEAVLAAHPRNELRLERLERPGRRYVLPDHHALSQLMPGWAPYSSVDQE